MFKNFKHYRSSLCVILVLIFAIICVAGACSKQPAPETGFAASTLAMKGFDADYLSLYGDDDAAIDAIYQEALSQPHFLAGVVSAFPSLLEQCGVKAQDAIEINRLLCLDENGGELQKQLLQALNDLLNESEVLFDDGFGGYATMLYPVANLDSVQQGDSITALDVAVVWVPIYQNQPCVMVKSPAEEVCCFDLACDLQRFIPNM